MAKQTFTPSDRPTSQFMQWLEQEKQNGLIDCKLMASANADAGLEDTAANALALARRDDGIEVKPYHHALTPEYY